jgi:hypothetical protein
VACQSDHRDFHMYSSPLSLALVQSAPVLLPLVIPLQ